MCLVVTDRDVNVQQGSNQPCKCKRGRWRGGDCQSQGPVQSS